MYSVREVNLYTYLICFLLLFDGDEGRQLRRTLQQVAETDTNSGTKSVAMSTKYYLQKFSIKSSEDSDCVFHGSCTCRPVGKCTPCSRIDINHKLPECLVSGYKQRSFCSDTKRERYISCHYTLDPRESRRFWLFEGSVFSVGVLAYAVVVFRIRKMERLTAQRIQEQINA